ncbi:glycine hydroxymethyltransferase [Streptomyces olivoverticillatus]|uniref:Serine hydroxymethyltransferase n=1 Tax=Streptomyces olivoverticillatus TaxID=66427 RepID=A0A7W7LJB3_9ACTN|nr:serine hydroxymethyltransferase [Streptomyces olivoverticillatus]MBB4891293.1 glycine hydroxymethyltransferase [Streptomyces olivoverticillatus]
MSVTPAPTRGASTATERTPRVTAGAAAHPGPHPGWESGFGELLHRDPEIAGLLLGEADRQSAGLQLIAAENFTSPAVLAALGSPLANKYAEGYPGARHHGGCELVDLAERIAVDRAKALFGAEHANVQPHSGSAAVLAAYAALLRPGDPVLAMALRQGGHLTHGSAANISGRWYDFTGYGVDARTGLVDYAQVRALARAHRPRAIVCGSISYPRHIDYARFREIADEVGAYLIVDAAHPIGLVAGGAAPNPVPYADVVCATTHKVLRGPRGGLILCRVRLAERIDRAVYPLTQGGAQMHTIAAKAVAFGEAATVAFTAYAHQVVANGRALAAGLAAEGLDLATGGTDTHLITADVAPLGLDALTARARLAAARVVLDTCGLAHAPVRGLRLGTAAVTTQGMGEAEMTRIAELLGTALRGGDTGHMARAGVAELAGRFPPYPAHM